MVGCQQGSDRIWTLASFERPGIKSHGQQHHRLIARYYRIPNSIDESLSLGSRTLTTAEREALEMVWRIQSLDESCDFPEPAVVRITSDEAIWNMLNARARRAVSEEPGWSSATLE
jgi:hypothetical protein